MRSPSGVSSWTSFSGWGPSRLGWAGVGGWEGKDCAAVVAPPDSTVTCHSFQAGTGITSAGQMGYGSRTHLSRSCRVRCVPGGAHTSAVPHDAPHQKIYALMAQEDT